MNKAERYKRQTVLPEIGEAGQARINAALCAGDRCGRAWLSGVALSGRGGGRAYRYCGF